MTKQSISAYVIILYIIYTLTELLKTNSNYLNPFIFLAHNNNKP